MVTVLSKLKFLICRMSTAKRVGFEVCEKKKKNWSEMLIIFARNKERFEIDAVSPFTR